MYGCGEKLIPMTLTIGYWGSINGTPITMPWNTKTVIVSSEWLKANPPQKIEQK